MNEDDEEDERRKEDKSSREIHVASEEDTFPCCAKREDTFPANQTSHRQVQPADRRSTGLRSAALCCVACMSVV